MKLYLISQTEERGYDTYSTAVVAAENEKEARREEKDKKRLRTAAKKIAKE